MIIVPMENCCQNMDSRNANLAKVLYEYTGCEADSSDLNCSFLKYYESIVFTKKEQLAKVIQDVDVIVFCGYAGAGHFSAAYSIAKEISRQGYNAIIVDMFSMLMRFSSKFACKSWLFVSRYAQWLFSLACKFVSKQFGIDLLYNYMRFKKLDTITDFIQQKNIKVCISTYIYPNAILGKLGSFAKNLAMVATDYSSIGMLAQTKNIEWDNITVFVPDKFVYHDAERRYPSIKFCKEMQDIGGIPSFMNRSTIDLLRYETKDTHKPNVLTFFIGGGLGIGYGIRGVKTVIESYNDGPIIIVCGDNKRWIKKVNKIVENYPDKKVIVFGYVKPKVALELMVISKIIVSKAGGITSAEMTALDGVKIFYGSIAGHEKKQAEMFSKLFFATYCKNKKELKDAICSETKTNGVYTLFPYKSPAEKIADWVDDKLKGE